MRGGESEEAGAGLGFRPLALGISPSRILGYKDSYPAIYKSSKGYVDPQVGYGGRVVVVGPLIM